MPPLFEGTMVRCIETKSRTGIRLLSHSATRLQYLGDAQVSTPTAKSTLELLNPGSKGWLG